MEQAPIAEPKPIMRLGRDEYEGLHQRYEKILQGMNMPDALPLMGDKEWQEIKSKLSSKFNKLMKGLFRQKGATLDINILASDEAQDFINTHAGVLDSSFEKVEMTPKMHERLTRSNYIFSGIKAFHELNEAFPSMVDENGDKKPFERFLNDVRKIDEKYNANYLHSEYNFVAASATMAAKWEQFAEDGDRYYLQYRTAHDDKVRPEHAALDGVTLPMSDPFWESYYPPNGWNCRCTVAQVRKQKYPATDHSEAMSRGEEALSGDKLGMFRFNPGIQGKAMPDYNPYTIKRCNDCDIAKGGSTKLAFVPDNEVCAACRIVRACANRDAKQTKLKAKPLQGSYIRNSGFGSKVLISKNSIKEWVNQPYKHVNAKNKILLDIKSVFGKATYLGTADNHKGVPHLVQSHIFETEVQGDKAYIIVREYDWHEFILYSLSEGGKLLKHIKKKK